MVRCLPSAVEVPGTHLWWVQILNPEGCRWALVNITPAGVAHLWKKAAPARRQQVKQAGLDARQMRWGRERRAPHWFVRCDQGIVI